MSDTSHSEHHIHKKPNVVLSVSVTTEPYPPSLLVPPVTFPIFDISNPGNFARSIFFPLQWYNTDYQIYHPSPDILLISKLVSSLSFSSILVRYRFSQIQIFRGYFSGSLMCTTFYFVIKFHKGYFCTPFCDQFLCLNVYTSTCICNISSVIFTHPISVNFNPRFSVLCKHLDFYSR